MTTKPLKIATMVTGNLVAPPPFIYAPIELAMQLSQQLVKHDHIVDYYGPEGTEIPQVNITTCGLTPLATSEEEYQAAIHNPSYGSHMRLGADDLYLARAMYEGDYDIVHFHHFHVANALAAAYPQMPTITTLHDPISDDHQQQIMRSRSRNSFFVAISEAQRRAAPRLPYIATIHNGIDTDFYQPLRGAAKKGNYLLWAARIVPEKGLDDAIEVALATGHELHIAGPIYRGTQDYFDHVVGPHLKKGSPIRYLGLLNPIEIVHETQRAKAFLMPIKWEEPFGLTVVQAMACGTPPIAYARGAMPELIRDGKTGFLVNNTQEMIAAVGKINSLDPKICRQHAERHFSLAAMANNYIAAYRAVI